MRRCTQETARSHSAASIPTPVAKLPAGARSGFKARYNIPGAYDIWWQVVNTGGHAAQENGLRGGFLRGHDLAGNRTQKNINWEQTAYTGRHWVQCFAIRDGVCIGKS